MDRDMDKVIPNRVMQQITEVIMEEIDHMVERNGIILGIIVRREKHKTIGNMTVLGMNPSTTELQPHQRRDRDIIPEMAQPEQLLLRSKGQNEILSQFSNLARETARSPSQRVFQAAVSIAKKAAAGVGTGSTKYGIANSVGFLRKGGRLGTS